MLNVNFDFVVSEKKKTIAYGWFHVSSVRKNSRIQEFKIRECRYKNKN